MTKSPQLHPMLLPLLPPLRPPRSKKLISMQSRARAELAAGACVPLSKNVGILQLLLLDDLRRLPLRQGKPGSEWLYVLDIVGPTPRVKIGRARNPWQRVSGHVREMNRYLYGLVDVYVTEPLVDHKAIVQAEKTAHGWMGMHYEVIVEEEFVDADFTYAMQCADIGVVLQRRRL